MDGFYYPDPHYMHEEFEDPKAPWNDTVNGYFGFGYVDLQFEVRRRYVLTVKWAYVLVSSCKILSSSQQHKKCKQTRVYDLLTTDCYFNVAAKC